MEAEEDHSHLITGIDSNTVSDTLHSVEKEEELCSKHFLGSGFDKHSLASIHTLDYLETDLEIEENLEYTRSHQRNMMTTT